RRRSRRSTWRRLLADGRSFGDAPHPYPLPARGGGGGAPALRPASFFPAFTGGRNGRGWGGGAGAPEGGPSGWRRHGERGGEGVALCGCARFLLTRYRGSQDGGGTMKRELEIRTADGTAKAAVFRPANAAVKAGVILYMDAFGPRPTMDEMAERLAGL